MEYVISFAIGILTGWGSNYLWHKWQSRRKDTHIQVQADSEGFTFSGRFNANATARDDDSKDLLSAINNAVNKK